MQFYVGEGWYSFTTGAPGLKYFTGIAYWICKIPIYTFLVTTGAFCSLLLLSGIIRLK